MKNNWKKEMARALLLVFVWSLVAAAVNTVSPRRIAWVGPWPSTFGDDSAAVPPSYTDDDAPVLRLQEAFAMFQSPEVVFIDARDPADYEWGHIPGAINFPFDYYDEYADSVLPRVDKSAQVVTYCGGADCELSLYLARQLSNEGYENIFIFFGGQTAWEEAELPMEETDHERP